MSHFNIWWNVWAVFGIAYIFPSFFARFAGLWLHFWPLTAPLGSRRAQVLRFWKSWNRSEIEFYTIHIRTR